jgi:class 3 adenylate cyclase
MSANTEQRKLAAIMFTDMVGYSALVSTSSLAPPHAPTVAFAGLLSGTQ